MSINRVNVNRVFEISSSIVEWDMRRAGLSIIKEYKLLPEEMIEHLSLLSKKDSDVAIGKLQTKDKNFASVFDQKFTDVMKEFLQSNEIDWDLDVLSIKKDACFLINKTPKITEFGKYIKFVNKNKYHAYILIDPMEFYFSKEGEIEVKHLVSDKTLRSQILNSHKDGILNFLEYTIELAERTQMNMEEMNTFLHEFVSLYKNKELEFDYYREFNRDNKFRYQFAGAEVLMENIDEKMLEKVNIEYNYKKIILPLINLVVQ